MKPKSKAEKEHVTKVGDKIQTLDLRDPMIGMNGPFATIVRIGTVSKDDAAWDPSLSALVGSKKYWVEWEDGRVTIVMEGFDSFMVYSQEQMVG